MAMHIRGEEIDQLAEEYQKLTGAKTKADAVRSALRRAIREETERAPLCERVGSFQDDLAALGRIDPAFDMKRFTDEMWGET